MMNSIHSIQLLVAFSQIWNHLIDMMYIFNLIGGIPLGTLIFMSYNNQGISIFDPVTGSW